jgi:iron complex outermembrane receptor protein
VGAKRLKRIIARSSFSALVAAAACPAWAQATQDEVIPPESPAAPQAVAEAEEGDEFIVVTGTRLQSGLTTPTPVTISTAEQLAASSPSILSEALNQLPVFRGSSRPTNSTQSSGRENGASFLSLRGLGKERTLVLLDGRRSVPSSAAGVPDVSLFPQDLVERVEIVTGGASAAYGSDAVAGVVNYILDRDFTGLRLSARAGISEYGDGGTRQVSLSAGTRVGRGRIIASVEYFVQDEIEGMNGRDWHDRGWGLAPSGQTNPTRLIAAPVNFSMSYGGLISSGPLAGQQFLPGGGLAPFNFGTNRSGSTLQVGGDGVLMPFNLTAGLERVVGFVRGEHPIGDVTVYAEGMYADVTAD